MTSKPRTDPRKNFVPRFLPWVLALAALVFYGLTLNRWISLFNLNPVARISGWMWQPDLTSPLTFLATYPFHWLPTPLIPAALNLFSAACAALTLGLLARSVAVLPQDRTEAQRKREHSDFSFLTLRSAWLPPVLAVAVCGLQMTFWENATSFTGEMIDLLLFAYVVRSLLEYRLDERESRLFLAALVYGAAMTNNWAMIGFLPAFIAAVIWLRGLSFFNFQFLKRMLLCGLAGTLLYLLLPLLAVISAKAPVTFWQALKLNWSSQFFMLKEFFIYPDARQTVLLLSLTSLVPILVLSFRWKSTFGDQSALGTTLTTWLLNLAFATLLVICLWVAFDPPFSPRHLGPTIPYPLGTASFLTFYYLGALAVGYFCGYFLLIFGKAPSSRLPSAPPPLSFLNPVVIAGVWLLAAAAIAGLLYRNLPQIRAVNDNTLQKYAKSIADSLPRSGGILLCDPDNSGLPRQLFLTQAALAREGRSGEFMPIDTQSLNWPAYLRFLHRKYPVKLPELVTGREAKTVNPLAQISILTLLAKSNTLYYLHPSFGYFFEQFYLEPHGPVYQLKLLPADTLLPPLPDKKLVAENDAFWTHVQSTAFAPIEQAVAPADPNAPQSRGESLLDQLHVPREPNPNAIVAGFFYSRKLDFWGVQLQRAGELTNAADFFAQAAAVNPDNVVAQINLKFNGQLRAGQHVTADMNLAASDQFGKFHSWNEVLNANGPFDEPSFTLAEGILMAGENGFFRQAASSFARVVQLDPANLAARLWLGQIYVLSHLPDRALEVLRKPLEQPEQFSLARTNETQLNVIAAAAYLQKNDLAQGTQLLQTEIALHPDDDNLLSATVQAYLTHGLFDNALKVIDHKLRTAPDDPAWLFSRGYTCIQMKNYDGAIAAFTRVLAVQTNNSGALFNRALANLDSGRLDAARTDYQALQHSYTNSFQIAYGLGEIAWRKHDTNEAIKNYELYLANADTNTAEATNIIARLRALKGH